MIGALGLQGMKIELKVDFDRQVLFGICELGVRTIAGATELVLDVLGLVRWPSFHGIRILTIKSAGLRLFKSFWVLLSLVALFLTSCQ